MSLETITFKDELEQINETMQELLARVSEFIKFIGQPNAFDDDAEFERKLSAIEEKVIMMTELTVPPSEKVELIRSMALPQQGQQPTQQQPETRQLTLEQLIPETSFTLPKALVGLASIVVSGIAVERMLLPPIALIGVIGAVLAFAFAPQLKQLIQAFMEKKPKAEEEELTLEEVDKISAIFSEIRSSYVRAYFLNRWQMRPGEPIPEIFEGLGLPDELVVRGEYIRKTDPHAYINAIMTVVKACERSAWKRKEVIISAMVQSNMAMFSQR